VRFFRTLFGRVGFTVLQAAVVLGVIGVVATIVGPRMSRAGAPSPRLDEHLLAGHLAALRQATRAYAADHAGHFPDPDPRLAARQLLEYTDDDGHPNPARTPVHRLGPYLREIPPLPVGRNAGAATLDHVASPNSPAGWLYDPRTGNVIPNTHPDERDADGEPYAIY
jgi:type II secretory pathway pseudopilin PulG